MPNTYTPTYVDEDDYLPSPFGKFGKEIEATKSKEKQQFEAKAMLTFLNTEGTAHHTSLTTTSTPTPLLIKVPGTHMVRFITGLAPYVNDPFSNTTSHLEGHFLAIMQDIDNVNEDAAIIRLPGNILRVSAVMTPTVDQFKAKLETGEEPASGTTWFQQNPVKDNTADLAKVAPLPPYLAYDAFTDDLPAHILWERIELENVEGMEEVFKYAQNFLMATHVSHNSTNANNLQVDSQYFMERPSIEAKQWGRLRTATIFPKTMEKRTSKPAATASPPTTAINALTNILTKHTPTNTTSTTTADADDSTYKKFGMSGGDLARALQMCGLTEGQEEHLPQWFSDIAEKNLSTDGKRNVIKILFKGSIPYEEHDIPTTPAIMDLIIKKSWIGDGDGTTATGVMKGLSPYLFTAITAEEVEHETNFAEAVRSSTSATVADLQKLKQKKATAPKSHQVLVATLKTFANALERLFTGRGPLYMVLRANIITPLTKLTTQAKSLINKTTLASIMWGCYKQSQHYAMGLMTGQNALVAEWQIMSQNIMGGAQDFNFLEVPIDISGTASKEKDKSKPNSPEKPPMNDDTQDKPNTPTKRRKIQKVQIHPAIKAKVTALLPDKLNMKKLCNVCDIKTARMIFPNSDICVPTALTGQCPYYTCKNSHNPEKITDVIAEAAISILDPFIRNPLSLNEG
jgi:hypothetical protein